MTWLLRYILKLASAFSKRINSQASPSIFCPSHQMFLNIANRRYLKIYLIQLLHNIIWKITYSRAVLIWLTHDLINSFPDVYSSYWILAQRIVNKMKWFVQFLWESLESYAVTFVLKCWSYFKNWVELRWEG